MLTWREFGAHLYVESVRFAYGRSTSLSQAAEGVGVKGTVFVLASIAAVLAVWFTTQPTNADVSWLLTVGERWLAGERLYVDVIEVNPPASVMLYVPAILLGRLVRCAPETALVVLTISGAGASLGLCAAILRRGGMRADRENRMLLCGTFLVLTAVPTGTFAQREHIALLAALPWLACLALRAEGGSPAPLLALLAGMGGGIAMAIKPMFALGFAGPLLLVLIRRGWRPLISLDLQAAWTVAACYGLAVLVLLPAFAAGPLQWVLLAYVPARLSLIDLLGLGVTTLWLGLVACYALSLRSEAGLLARTAILSSLGFEVVFLLQGKGWAYQDLPAILLAGLACWLCVADAVHPRTLVPQFAGSALLLVLASNLFAKQPGGDKIPGLAAAISRLAPHPRMMEISAEIADGHPLVRQVGGRWVGTFCSNWITAGLVRQRGTLASDALRRLQALSERERAIMVRDIAAGRPDVILLQDGKPWTDYVAQGPELASALQDFRPEGHYGTLTLLVRRDRLDQERTP